MHILNCDVTLGGDAGSVHPLYGRNAVTWPEITVLQILHGRDSINNMEIVSEIPNPRVPEEIDRLIRKYGIPPVQAAFPGGNPHMEFEMPGGEVPVQPELAFIEPPFEEPTPEELAREREAEVAKVVMAPRKKG
jgi:hypothetical protein